MQPAECEMKVDFSGLRENVFYCTAGEKIIGAINSIKPELLKIAYYRFSFL